MGIYTRDNINYGGMLGNAMAQRAGYLKNRYDAVRQMGQNWGNAVANSGKIVQDAAMKYATHSMDMDKLANQQEFQANESVKRAEEQLARQREQNAWQAAQNDLSRQTTKDIAELNKQNQDAAKIDEWTKYYNVANAKLAEYDALLRKNPNDEILKFQRAQAQAEVNMYGSKLGIVRQPSVDAIPTQTGAAPATDPSSYNNVELTKNIDDLLNGKWTNADKESANSYLNNIQDPAIREQYATKINKKGLTVEEQNAESLAFKQEAQASLDANVPKTATGSYKPGALAKWKKNNPKYAKALGY